MALRPLSFRGDAKHRARNPYTQSLQGKVAMAPMRLVLSHRGYRFRALRFAKPRNDKWSSRRHSFIGRRMGQHLVDLRRRIGVVVEVAGDLVSAALDRLRAFDPAALP